MRIYIIKDMSSEERECKILRRNTVWDSQRFRELKEVVKYYKPLRYMDVSQSRILLVGPIGAGKSSFFNTINSIFRGYVTSQACSGNAEHSLTPYYRMYQVRDIQMRSFLNFRLCDTPGLEEDQGLDSHEICSILDGKVPDKYMLNPSFPFSDDKYDAGSSTKLGDRIHVVAFVLDASTVYVMSEKVLEKIKSMQLKMNIRGIPQVVLLTKIDKISESLTDDVSKTFNMKAISDCIDRVSQIIGLPRSHILPVKNYEQEAELDESINILALLAMQQILRFADDFLYNEFEYLSKKIYKQNRRKVALILLFALCILCVIVFAFVQ